jgi:signal transduction histidine kinase
LAIDEEQLEFLEAIARTVAELTSRAVMRTQLDESARDQALAAERERIAADLHDSIGQRFVALGLLARQHLRRFDEGSDEAAESLRLAELAEEGKAQTVEAIRAGAFVPAGRRGLEPAVRGLAESFELDSGMTIQVAVSGRPVRLASEVERALYRVAHEALMNAWRHARCTLVHVELDYTRSEFVLSVTDDGVGIDHAGIDPGTHMGVANMTRSIEQLGGTLDVTVGDTGGTCVRANAARTAR